MRGSEMSPCWDICGSFLRVVFTMQEDELLGANMGASSAVLGGPLPLVGLAAASDHFREGPG